MSSPKLSTRSLTRNGKKHQEDELNIDEIVRCFEPQVGRYANEKTRINVGDMLDLSSPDSDSSDADYHEVGGVPTAVLEIVTLRTAYSPA